MVDLGGIFAGLTVIGVGALGVYRAYWLARLSERLDSIGSRTPWEDVEPAVWKVWVTRLLFAFVGTVGVVILILFGLLQ